MEMLRPAELGLSNYVARYVRFVTAREAGVPLQQGEDDGGSDCRSNIRCTLDLCGSRAFRYQPRPMGNLEARNVETGVYNPGYDWKLREWTDT